MPIARFDRLAFTGLILAALALSVRAWLADHPGDNPWAPLDLNDAPGWATPRKVAALRNDPAGCRAVLERSGVAYSALEPAGSGGCAREDRVVLLDYPFAPKPPPTTCAVGAALELWLRQSVQPAAQDLLGSRVERIEHLGSYSCRRLYGRAAGAWSEHATGNAIDLAAFTLADGRRISVARDWTGDGPESVFLRRIHEGGCKAFGTVLGPDYNSAHHDHFHLDQAPRGFGSVCR